MFKVVCNYLEYYMIGRRGRDNRQGKQLIFLSRTSVSGKRVTDVELSSDRVFVPDSGAV